MSDKIEHIKLFWYCDDHDDAFYEIMISEDFNKTKICQSCCDKECCLIYIGQRIFEGNIIIKDDTPSDSYFNQKGGGFKREYLDKVTQL